MLALVYNNYGSIENMKVSEFSSLEMADDEVLIRVYCASINPYDKKLRNGDLQDFFDVEFPVIPGRDGCGELISIGKDVQWYNDTPLAIGQRVCFLSSSINHGAFAEYVSVKAATNVALAPANLSDEECAALPLIGVTAYCALVETAEVCQNMKILIHGGSGGVGSMAIQLAQHLGAEVFATCSSANIELVEALGATAIPYNGVDFTQVINNCDIVMDTIGGEVNEKSYSVLKKDGRLVYLIAKPFKDMSDDFNIETRRIMVMDKPNSFNEMITLVREGVMSPNVSDTFTLNNFKEAFSLMEIGKPKGKIIIKINNIKGSTQDEK